MTVGELIERLEDLDPNLEIVAIQQGHYEIDDVYQINADTAKLEMSLNSFRSCQKC